MDQVIIVLVAFIRVSNIRDLMFARVASASLLCLILRRRRRAICGEWCKVGWRLIIEESRLVERLVW